MGDLSLYPTHDQQFRWKPQFGDPTCILELLSQWTWQHRLAVYTAVIVTLVLVVQLTGVGQ